MNTLNEISLLLSKHKLDLYKRFSIKELGVFGSYSRGEQNKRSDIDILVEFEKPIGLDFVTLAEELEKILNKKVDLISKAAIKPKIWNYIKNDVTYV